ncbi:MAG: exodeoxyribonuclease VII small subunit [Saprospiraceae bacterium]|nr:exodeoxyribonuclease VII small subunit [Saprospiraceae bacterium]
MKKISFDQAYEELRQIVEELQGEDVSIDKLGEQLKKATELVKFCKTKLRDVEDEINSMDTTDEDQ